VYILPILLSRTNQKWDYFVSPRTRSLLSMFQQGRNDDINPLKFFCHVSFKLSRLEDSIIKRLEKLRTTVLVPRFPERNLSLIHSWHTTCHITKRLSRIRNCRWYICRYTAYQSARQTLDVQARASVRASVRVPASDRHARRISLFAHSAVG
jgi:hypothetical protein